MFFLLLSALYFADTSLHASLKTFWMDELFTVYLCRLPSFHATWTAVMHGCDFNPPLFYLLTRGAQTLFGEGLIATRLPAVLGLWVFGASLYLFAARRLGPVRGLIAALFPVFTLAHSYAYEARPHGVVLGWCGIMLLCWQRAREWTLFSPWLFGLLLSFLAALLTHVYAVYLVVPILFAEAAMLLRRQRIHLGITATVVLAPILVAPLYLGMAKTYTSLNSVGGLLAHPYEILQNYLVAVLGPSLLVLLVVITLIAWYDRGADINSSAAPSRSLTDVELFLALGFALLPVIGALGVAFSHGPFFDRYFLSATAGYALLFAQSSAFPRGRNFVARGLLASMLSLLVADTGLVLYAHVRHANLRQIEPASHFAFPANPSEPLWRDGALLQDKTGLDILVTEDHNYLYLYYYAPPEIRRRLVFGAPEPDDLHLVSYLRLARWANLDLRASTYQQFFATHNDFLVYSSTDGLYNGSCFDCLQHFLTAGYTLRSVHRDFSNLLEHFSR